MKIGREYLATMLALSAFTMEPGTKKRLSPADMIEKCIAILPRDNPKPKGVKRYVIDGVEVWAINERNVIRKAKNKNNISF